MTPSSLTHHLLSHSFSTSLHFPFFNLYPPALPFFHILYLHLPFPHRKLTSPSPTDAREPGELIQTGRIPGAINIPITTSPDSFFISEDEFEDRFGYPRPSKDSEVVFYCKAGVRSRGAAGLAREAGWEKVGEYPGSWLDWAGRGGRVEH